jgi:membrane fusion protein (multidrug efflux system)
MNDSTKAPASSTAAATPSGSDRMRRIRMPLMIGGSLVIIAIGAFLYFASARTESTNDAYVNAARVAISTNVPGRVIELNVHDNQRVHRGDVLFRLDDRPFQLAVSQARAKLSSARLQIESMKALYGQRQSELRSAQDTLAFETRETQRQQRLLTSGISSQAQVDRAVHARDSAAQAAAAAQQQIASVIANLGGDPNVDPTKHPSVEQAQAELDRALLDLSYASIAAPDDGIVTQVERLQVGDYVNAASPVFALVSTHNLWIDANFKEVQVSKMRAGQTATVKIDTYGDKTFKAHIVSISPGTGSQFSVLPAQNATGNWVKVVQRLAVRLEIDNPDRAHPLYAGLSATVKIDTKDQQGAPLADDDAAPESEATPASSAAPAASGVERVATRNPSN